MRILTGWIVSLFRHDPIVPVWRQIGNLPPFIRPSKD